MRKCVIFSNTIGATDAVVTPVNLRHSHLELFFGAWNKEIYMC
jgi:hypothetical protein